MVCRVFLIRHGETLWNSEMRFQGHADVPLSEAGVSQAKALGRRLAGQQIAAVYSSDLGRALDTAREIAIPRGMEITTVPELREMNFGSWEGLSFKEIKQNYGELLQQWWADPLGITIPGGEGLQDLASRVVSALRGIVARHPGEKVAVVCHGGPVRCLVSSVLGMDLIRYWKIRQDNAALNILDFPEDWDNGVVMRLNDRSHLDGDLEMEYAKSMQNRPRHK